MADTGQKNYSKNEALNRIVRALIGSPNPTDAPDTLWGSVLSINGALSKLAEVLEGNDNEETLTIPDANFSDITSDGDITAAGFGAVSGSFACEDLTVQDAVDARTLDSTEISAGTGTFYAGFGEVSVGGFSTDALFGNGEIVLGIGPASTIPSGTLAHLGGVLFAQGGALKWLGSSGTVSTIAGS